MKKYDNKTIEKLIFRYFNIRNFGISKFQSFNISSFKILTPVHLENKNYERLNVERPLLPTTFNARGQKFERLKWQEVKN